MDRWKLGPVLPDTGPLEYNGKLNKPRPNMGRPMSRMYFRAAVLVATWGLAGLVSAETFYLTSGGRINGVLLNPDEKPRTEFSIRLANGGEITLDAKEVRRFEALSQQQRKYQNLLKQMPKDSAENHWVMAEWCRKQRLTTERNFHLEQVISKDPNHEQARRALKYKQLEDGTWARTEEIMESRGYTQHEGRWETSLEVAIATEEEAREDAVVQWQRDIKMWRGWLGKRRHQQAVENIGSIEDPAATPALVKWFYEERGNATREELAEILGRLNSSLATRALTTAAMEAGNSELRIHCVKQLKDNKRVSAIPTFVRELGSKDNARVNRAAYALGKIGDESVILPLIQALRTDHKFKVGSDSNNMTAGFNKNASARNGLGGLSMGNRSKIISRTLDNKSVRNALVALTDKDFDYNESAWKLWYLSRTTPPDVDLRRDP